MKPLTFPDYHTTGQAGIVTFTPFYERMIKEIKMKLNESKTIDLYLGRLSDTGFSVEPKITHFFDVQKGENQNEFKVSYYGDYFDTTDQKLPIQKTIRFDNPFGEIAILPGYETMPKFFEIGKDLQSYQNFITAVREMLNEEIGNCIQLCYKNQDGSYSVVHGELIQVNKGNIFMEDYNEIKVINNQTVSGGPLLHSRKKNHRFVSQNGYLFAVNIPCFQKGLPVDDGQVYGDTFPSPWNFTLEVVFS